MGGLSGAFGIQRTHARTHARTSPARTHLEPRTQLEHGVGKVLEHFAAWLKMHVADAKKIAALEVFTTEVSKDLVKAASAPW